MRVVAILFALSVVMTAIAGSLSQDVLVETCGEDCQTQNDAGLPGDAVDSCGAAAFDRPVIPKATAPDGLIIGEVVLVDDPSDVYVFYADDPAASEMMVVLTWTLPVAATQTGYGFLQSQTVNDGGAYILNVYDANCAFVGKGHYHESADGTQAFLAGHIQVDATAGATQYYAQVMREPLDVLGHLEPIDIDPDEPVQTASGAVDSAFLTLGNLDPVPNCHVVCGDCAMPLPVTKYGLCTGPAD